MYIVKYILDFLMLDGVYIACFFRIFKNQTLIF